MRYALFSNKRLLPAILAALVAGACADDGSAGAPAVPDETLLEAYYAGGELGTAFNSTSAAFEQPTPAVDADAAMTQSFLNGEQIFERPFNTGSTGLRSGLGPLYTRTSCFACHPGYAHGARISSYRTRDSRNGCLLIVTDREGTILSSLGLVPHTAAVAPFKPMIDESLVNIEWLPYADEWGNEFPDGEKYELIYPEVTIPEEAFYVPLRLDGRPIAHADIVVTLESTIGIYGTGLLDAIDDADLKAQYQAEERAGVPLNPAIFADGDWTALDSEGNPFRFDYALDASSIQGNASLWEVTNVVRPTFRYLYIPADYAEVACEDPDVRADFYALFPEWNRTGDVGRDIYDYLTSTEQPVEIGERDRYELMVWHRGLAVPAARNLDAADVQRGRELFSSIGCAYCHRPTWTTGSDSRYKDPYGIYSSSDRQLPRYPYQKIWPYTDLVQHRLFMKNDIRTGWCRTTPLWGRGLYRKCTGSAESDRLHDCRARTVIEAIMWHGAAQSDARWTVEAFRGLSKEDRDAVVAFIEAI